MGRKLDELLAALKEIALRPLPKLEDASAKIYLLLPSKDGMPLPSNSILGEAPSSNVALELKPFSAPALAIAFSQISQLLHIVKDSGEGIPAPGIMLSNDLSTFAAPLSTRLPLCGAGLFFPI